MSWTLWASAGLTFVSTIIFAYAARTVLSWDSDTSSRPALVAFATWWISLSVATLSQALILVAASMELATVPIVQTHLQVLAISVCVSVGALLYYFVFLRWGRSALWPIVTIYAAVYTYYLYLLTSATPTGVDVSSWSVKLEQAAAAPAGGRLLPLLLLVVPPIIGALFYWPLVSNAADAGVRYRGRLISVAIIAWFGGTFGLSFVTDETVRVLLSQAAGMMAATVTFFAYRPPKMLRRWWPPQSGIAARDGTTLRDSPASLGNGERHETGPSAQLSIRKPDAEDDS